MTRALSILLLALLGGGCATKGGWPCWSFQRNTDQKNAAAVPQATSKVSSIVSVLNSGKMLGDFIYPPDVMDYSWTLQFSEDLQTWKMIAFWPYPLLAPPAGTMNVRSNNRIGFYRMVGTNP